MRRSPPIRTPSPLRPIHMRLAPHRTHTLLPIRRQWRPLRLSLPPLHTFARRLRLTTLTILLRCPRSPSDELGHLLPGVDLSTPSLVPWAEVLRPCLRSARWRPHLLLRHLPSELIHGVSGQWPPLPRRSLQDLLPKHSAHLHPHQRRHALRRLLLGLSRLLLELLCLL